jgi:hypothetical protein
MTNSTHITSSISERREPSALESLGVLAGILAQAAAVSGWDTEGFGKATLQREGDIEIFVHAEEIGKELTRQLDLAEFYRKTYRSHRLYASQDTRELTHVVRWKGTVAGHEVAVWAQWYSPLGDLDLAEGEELA